MARSSGGSSAFAGPTRVILGGLAVLALVYLFFGVRAWMRNQRTLEEIERVRSAVLAARAEADACTSRLALDESVFQRTNATVDSLRAVVNDAEEPLPEGGRGVDAREYEAYMESFDAYNRTVEDWEAQAEGLRARQAECTELIEYHNRMADSLRTLLEESGVAR